MFKSLYGKIALAFVLVALFTAALLAVFFRVSSSDRLAQLIMDQQRGAMQTALVNYYTANGSWRGVDEEWGDLQRSVSNDNQKSSNPDDGPDGHERRVLFGLADADGRVIVATERQHPAGTLLTRRILNSGTKIVVNGQTVGTILAVKQFSQYNPEETLFLQRTNRALLLAVGGTALIALVVGLFLSRTLTRPLKALTQAAQGITAGQLQQEVKINSQDEIGQLAAAFNTMSREVARVNRQRKQMTADIAHDLRTPLTVIGGYVESMRDGVLQPTPQRFDMIYAEIERLQHLVGDLRMLSQVDAGELPLNPQRIAPAALVERAAQLFQHQAQQQNITLQRQVAENLPEIHIDEARMMQVLGNLLSNAFRYTSAGGSITLGAQAAAGKVRLLVRDTGSGIEPDELPYIFDRFHRADKSRHAESGESGLGLAIVKALVEAQGGRVWVESSAGQGASFYIELPAA